MAVTSRGVGLRAVCVVLSRELYGLTFFQMWDWNQSSAREDVIFLPHPHSLLACPTRFPDSSHAVVAPQVRTQGIVVTKEKCLSRHSLVRSGVKASVMTCHCKSKWE